MSKIIEKYIEQFQTIDSIQAFDKTILELNEELEKEEYYKELHKEIRQKQKYMKNRFSDEANKEKMLAAKENVVECLIDFLDREKKIDEDMAVIKYLKNFYLFMDALIRRELEKRATLSKYDLQKIQIQNEYDLQHLLYAVLKLNYPDIRKEVAEDSGVGMVRSDLKIPSINTVIEAKCTRNGMSLKKLTEEIEADIVHYTDKHIIFFVYDKAKIIKEEQNYKKYFTRVFDGKKVEMVIQQPIEL